MKRQIIKQNFYVPFEQMYDEQPDLFVVSQLNVEIQVEMFMIQHSALNNM